MHYSVMSSDSWCWRLYFVSLVARILLDLFTLCRWKSVFSKLVPLYFCDDQYENLSIDLPCFFHLHFKLFGCLWITHTLTQVHAVSAPYQTHEPQDPNSACLPRRWQVSLLSSLSSVANPLCSSNLFPSAIRLSFVANPPAFCWCCWCSFWPMTRCYPAPWF